MTDAAKSLHYIQDTAATVQNLDLAAYSLGLGICWVGAFKEEEVRRILRIPDGVRPVALVTVGYPAPSPEPRGRRSVKQIIHYEMF